jgi:type I restriction enzyme M protein
MHWIAPSEKDHTNGTLEKRLWDSADQFRANSGLKAQEYSGPILVISFIRFVGASFQAKPKRQRWICETTRPISQ